MDILILGGTRFFGIHMVNELINQGHNITIATRGEHLINYDLLDYYIDCVSNKS